MGYPIVYLASIPNSGTNSLIRMVRECVGHDKVVGAHIVAQQTIQDVERIMGRGRTVIPLRHPAAVGYSNANRRNPWQTPAFNRLHQLYLSDHDTHFVRVDCPEDERPEELAGLCDWLGVRAPEDLEWPHEHQGEYGWMTLDRKELLRCVISDISAPAHEWLKGYGYDLRAEWEAL